ncbi:phage tail length tape measure family protein [Pseudomonas luteola]|uniref:Phage tail length tape measure family protein n=1 Tax=Pseudomonas luteola TaxID=47886 RepID=A0ABS0MUY6_PSELU|nr:phage tail length tape measure family protein [Pseudomonas luteola]MBH3440548.1 phage tail length tape measure family protein [Pseudomonas luteola]
MNDLATLGLMVDSSQAVKAANDLNKLSVAAEQAENAASGLGDASNKAAAGQENLGDSSKKTKKGIDEGKKSIDEQRKALNQLLGQIDPTIKAFERLDEQERKLAQFKKAGALDADSFKDYSAKVNEARNALTGANDALNKTGISAKQTAAALRGVPAQFSDIVVSLQGGQAPLTVFLQQGSQLRDMFGSSGAAAKALGGYVAGLISPVTAVAGAAAALGVIFYDAEKEASAFNKALYVGSGNIGVSATQLSELAKQAGQVTGDISDAKDAFLTLAQAGNVSTGQLKNLGEAAAAIAQYSGKGADEIAKQFSGLGQNATEAAQKASSQFGLVTASQYEVIRALDDQGEHAKALDVLSEELNTNALKRLELYKGSLSELESDWNKVKTAISNTYAAVKSELFPDLNKQIQILERIQNTRKEGGFLGGLSSAFGFGDNSDEGIANQLKDLYRLRDANNQTAASEAELTRANQEYIKVSNQLNAQLDNLTPLDKRKKAVDDLNDSFMQLMKDSAILGKQSPLLVGVEYDGKSFSGGAYDKFLDSINSKNKDKPGVKAPLDLTSFNDAQNALKLLTSNYDNAEKRLEASQRAGAISSEAYYSQRVDLINKEKTDVTAAYQQEIIALEAIKGKSTTTGQQRIQLDQRIADARANMVKAQQDADGKLAVLATNEKARLDQSKAALEAYTAALNQNLESLKAQGDREAALVGLGQHQKDMFNKLADQERDYNRERLDLAKQYANGTGKLSEKEYNDRLNALDNYYRNAVQVVYDNEAKIQQAQSNWANGANAAWQDYLANARDIAGQTYNAFSDAFRSMEDALVNFVMTGKASFDDFVKSVIAGVLRIQAQKLIIGVGSSLGFGSSAFGSTGGGAAGSGYSLSDLYSMGTGAYNFVTGTGANLYSAYQAGGLGGVWNYGSSAISGAFGGSASAGAGYGIGQPLVTGSVGNAGYAASTGLLGSGVSGATAGLYGIGGALYGYQQSGLKGAIAGGLGAAGGAVAGGATAAALGAAAGSIIPGIGTAIGAALGGLLGGSLFGGKWQTKDVGLSLGVSGGDLDAQQYEYQKKKGGLFGSNKKRTRYSDLDDATQSALDATFDSLATTSQDIFTKLGIQVGDGALDGLNIAATQISTKDKSEEEIQQAITQWFTGVGDQMVTAINDATGQKLSGVVINGGLNLTGVTELANNLYIINDILDSLRLTSQALTVDGALANQALMNLAGGMDALKANTSAFYENYYTDAEKQADTLEAVRKQFQALNITMPETRESFRAAVEALDLTTAAGQDMFTKLTALAGTAATAYTILEAQATAAQQAAQEVLTNAVTTALGVVQRSIQKQQTALTTAYNNQVEGLNTSLTNSQANVGNLTAMTNSLSNALKTLLGQSDSATDMLYQQAQATLISASAIARAGGSLANFEGLDDALSTVTSNTTDRYSSFEDFARDQGRTANLVAELNAATGSQLTTAEKTAKGIQDQLTQAKKQYEMESAMLQGQLDYAQAQVDALNGIDNSVTSVSAAIVQLAQAIGAMAPAGTGVVNADALIEAAYQSSLGRSADAAGASYWKGQLASGAVTSGNLAKAIANAGAANGESINSAYQSILGRAPDAAGLAYWQKQVANGSVTDVYAAIKNAAVANGTALPSLDVASPSRIYNGSNASAASSSNAALIAEMRALRQENAEMKQYFYAIAKNTDKTARGIQQQNEMESA